MLQRAAAQLDGHLGQLFLGAGQVEMDVLLDPQDVLDQGQPFFLKFGAVQQPQQDAQQHDHQHHRGARRLADGEAAEQATVERIKPFATLVALDANAPRVEKSGQEVYDISCASCHATGALAAPISAIKASGGRASARASTFS